MIDIPLPEHGWFCVPTPDGGLACGRNDDVLTGCWNIRTGEAIVEQLRAANGGADGVLLLEVHVHLREINEAHGHAVGDDVLRAVAARLRSLPSGAYAYRSGGVTFVLPATAAPGGDGGIAAEVLAALGQPVLTRAGTVPVRVEVAVSPEGDSVAVDALA